MTAATENQTATTADPAPVNPPLPTHTRPKNKEPYQQAYYPPVPTGFTRHIRVNPVWQFYRLLVINWKIFRLMTRSHH